MARLNVPDHPSRVFKDETWNHQWDGASGYLSIGDHGSEPTRYGDLNAFAVEENVFSEDPEYKLIKEMMRLETPFRAVEICRIGGCIYHIGFFDPADME